MWRSTRRNGQIRSFPTNPACSRPVPPDLTSGVRTTVSRMRMERRFSSPGLLPCPPGHVNHVVSGVVNPAIWPVTALHRHHGLDTFVRRKTTVEREGSSEGTTAPESYPSPWPVRPGWRSCPHQGPIPPLQSRRPTLPGLGGHGVDHLPGASGCFSGHHRRTLGGVDGDQRSFDDCDGAGGPDEGKEAAGRPGG